MEQLILFRSQSKRPLRWELTPLQTYYAKIFTYSLQVQFSQACSGIDFLEIPTVCITVKTLFAREFYPAGENRMHVKERSRHNQERRDHCQRTQRQSFVQKEKKNAGFSLSLVSSLLHGKIINQKFWISSLFILSSDHSAKSSWTV